MISGRARCLAVVTAAALIAAICAVGCGSDQGSRPAAAPTPSQGLGRRAGQLLDGGPPAFRRELTALRGTPVVVNQWASWCGPCRFEFPFFAALARRYAGRVAFLGVDAQDSRGAALRFLERYRTPYPHYFDPSTAISREFRGGFAWPTTAFYDAGGRLTETHAGGYASQASLERDIRRFAAHG
ncbi:MAG: TlpA family protein disulfide reductase [Solirubrobacteraceae bacterium]